MIIQWFVFIVFAIWSVESFVKYKDETNNIVVGLLTLAIALEYALEIFM